jgi:hypothetical protein
MLSVPVGREGVPAMAVALPGASVWVLKEVPLASKVTVPEGVPRPTGVTTAFR